MCVSERDKTLGKKRAERFFLVGQIESLRVQPPIFCPFLTADEGRGESHTFF